MTQYTKSNLRHNGRRNVAKEQKWLGDHERQPWEQVQPHLPDSRYVHISHQTIYTHLLFMRKDPIMQLGQQTNLNHLLAGGATAEVGDIALDSAWVRKTIQQCYEYEHALGWVSFTWIPDNNAPGGKRGVILDPLQYDVYMRMNALSEPDCVYITRGNMASNNGDFLSFALGGGGGGGGRQQVLGGQVVPNVWTIWMRAPTFNGVLQSCAASVLPMDIELAQASITATVAETERAHPPLITEFKERKMSLEGLLTTSGEDLAVMKNLREATKSMKMYEDLQDYLANTERSIGSAQYQAILAAMAEWHAEKTAQTGRSVVEIDDERTLVPHQLPEVPVDMMERRIYLQQMKLMVQNVPPALVQAESSRSARLGVDQNAQGVFQQAQLRLRSHYSEVIEFMTGVMFAEESVASMLAGIPVGVQTPPAAEILRAVKPKVTIPGQPPPDVMRQLYLDGILKYSALRKHISGLYSIPLSDLNAEPEFSLEDLLTQGKLKLEKAKGQTAKETNESKERQLTQQAQIQTSKEKVTAAGSGSSSSGGGGTKRKASTSAKGQSAKKKTKT